MIKETSLDPRLESRTRARGKMGRNEAAGARTRRALRRKLPPKRKGERGTNLIIHYVSSRDFELVVARRCDRQGVGKPGSKSSTFSFIDIYNKNMDYKCNSFTYKNSNCKSKEINQSCCWMPLTMNCHLLNLLRFGSRKNQKQKHVISQIYLTKSRC